MQARSRKKEGKEGISIYKGAEGVQGLWLAHKAKGSVQAERPRDFHPRPGLSLRLPSNETLASRNLPGDHRVGGRAGSSEAWGHLPPIDCPPGSRSQRQRVRVQTGPLGSQGHLQGQDRGKLPCWRTHTTGGASSRVACAQPSEGALLVAECGPEPRDRPLWLMHQQDSHWSQRTG